MVIPNFRFQFKIETIKTLKVQIKFIKLEKILSRYSQIY
jgi:hypothetical protein